MLSHRFHRILRTAGFKSANGSTRQRREHRRNSPAIKSQEQEQNVLQKVHLINERRLAQEPEVIAFHGGEGLPDNGGSGNQNHIHRHPQHVLMQAYAFANEPAATIADDGFAEFAGGNHSETGRTSGRQFLPVQNQTALGLPVALLLEARKISPMPEPHGTRQPQPDWRIHA